MAKVAGEEINVVVVVFSPSNRRIAELASPIEIVWTTKEHWVQTQQQAAAAYNSDYLHVYMRIRRPRRAVKNRIYSTTGVLLAVPIGRDQTKENFSRPTISIGLRPAGAAGAPFPRGRAVRVRW